MVRRCPRHLLVYVWLTRKQLQDSREHAFSDAFPRQVKQPNADSLQESGDEWSIYLSRRHIWISPGSRICKQFTSAVHVQPTSNHLTSSPPTTFLNHPTRQTHPLCWMKTPQDDHKSTICPCCTEFSRYFCHFAQNIWRTHTSFVPGAGSVDCGGRIHAIGRE